MANSEEMNTAAIMAETGSKAEAAVQQSSQTNTADIEYLYLDFDTELPDPASWVEASKPGAATSSPPQPPPRPQGPDLRKYTSPFLWSKTRKLMLTSLACAVTLLAAYAAGEYTPASDQILPVWHVSEVAFNTGVTSFTSGFAIAPMALAPFSEINGRRPVFIASGVLFTGEYDSYACISSQNGKEDEEESRLTLVGCIFACGGTSSLGGMIVARFFQGVGGCTLSFHSLPSHFFLPSRESSTISIWQQRADMYVQRRIQPWLAA